MRRLVLVVLIALALLAVYVGHLGVALAIAALKTMLVGHTYMELDHAHPAHRWGFAGFAFVLAGVVAIVAT